MDFSFVLWALQFPLLLWQGPAYLLQVKTTYRAPDISFLKF